VVKVEAAECSAELPPAAAVANLPAWDEPGQPRDTTDADREPEAPVPVDGSNTDLFNGLPELDTTFTCVRTPSDGISLAVSLSRAVVPLAFSLAAAEWFGHNNLAVKVKRSWVCFVIFQDIQLGSQDSFGGWLDSFY
jgi:hypothetical protein